MSNPDPAASNPPLRNSGTNSDSEATFDSAASPAGVSAPDLGSIGPYRLIRKLGEGGMGQVWLAEQSAPVKRQVALKIIKAGQYDGSALLRFNVERQTLAIMDHPAIAKVFDAGSTAAGQPYFVMEYVPGLPITNYCDTKRLSARERLALLVKVCEGVQHAHQKAIIHRDLKPSNILVVEVDGKPMPRIIDFGIAKAISQQSEDETLVTRAGGTVGTPGYVSPEQADPSIPDVDTRTDVYSLGVVLYELLTGVLPFDVKHWKTKPFHEVLRQLHEDDPPSPSTRISGDPVSMGIAAKRNTDPRRLASMLSGDLDWITLKALEKDHTRRYGTPSELSADIGRYLRNEPVNARPASVAYRAKKYVQRHKFGVAAVSVMVLLLMAFGGIQTIQLRRITRERDRANRERDRATRVTDFMTGMFNVSDPSKARGNTITAREILDKSSAEIDTGLSQDPELKAQMMDVMGVVYQSLGLYSSSLPLLERSAEIRRRVLGPENPDTLATMHHLASTLTGEGHYAEAEKLQRETLEIQRRVLGPENPYTLLSMNNLAVVLYDRGHYVEAETLDRETLDIRRRVSGPEHPDTLMSMANLASALEKQGRYADAEKLDRETLDIRRRVSGPEHPATVGVMSNLAILLNAEQHYRDAEKLDREILDIQRRVLGPEHPGTLITMSNLANLLADENRLGEAEKLLRETMDIERRTLGPEHPLTLDSANNLSTILDDQGRYAEAEKLERKTLEIQRRVLGPEHPKTISSMYNLACYTARNGKREESLSLLQEAVARGGGRQMQTDPELKSLHGDPRFIALAAKIKVKEHAAPSH
ncbi:MAG: serine/threonine-protein kinase [Candidatus Sulfotelmatobacter sp.]